MERRFTFIIFVGGREYAALYDQCIKTDAELQAMKFGIWAAAAKFKATASVYVYRHDAFGDEWTLCSSLNARHNDYIFPQISDDNMKLMASAKHGRIS